MVFVYWNKKIFDQQKSGYKVEQIRELLTKTQMCFILLSFQYLKESMDY